MWMITAFVLYGLGALGFGVYAHPDFDPRGADEWAWLVGAAILWPIMAVWMLITTAIAAIRR